MSRQIANCQKISLGSKIAIAAGAAWLTLMLFRVVLFTPSGTFAALTAIIGGIVLLGSNSRTWSELEAERFERETQRAALIGRLPLRLVGDERATLH